MEKRCCRNCMYGKRPQGRWLRVALSRWPGMVICSVCADCPGKTSGVYAESYCRNFCPKPGLACEPQEPIVEPGETLCKIPLSQGLYALVDPEDYEGLSRYKWYACRCKHTYYAGRRLANRKVVLMHREIMKTPPGMVVDHKNLNGLDNRKRYLRNCTPRQNLHNSRPRCVQTGFKGVTYNELTGKYEAWIGKSGTSKKLGEFDDPVSAAKARDRKAWELQGEFAYLNFPDDLPRGDRGTAEPGGARIVLLKGRAVLHTKALGRLVVVRAEASGHAG